MLKHLTLGWSRLFTAIVLFVIIFGYSDTSAQKRVILEQFTGAWCGWCVDGSYVMDNIIAKYPDNFIGVKWHNGDGMQIVGYDTAASICMISGFPMGSVCRAGVNVNGQVTRGLSRGAWEQVTDQIVKATNVVDIEAFSSINTSTREISVIVNATFNTFLQGEARLNVYLCQDDVTGSGGAYDQHNYLSGCAGYENNPYYKLPGTITGYHHMKVVRFVLGGVFGAPNTITSTQAGAKNTATFKYTIPATATNASDKSSVIDLSKLFVVATVNTYTSNWSNLEILNCCYATKGTPSSEVTMTDPPQGVKPLGQSVDKPVNIKNVTSATQTYTLTLTKSSRTPADWTASVVLPSEVNGGKNEIQADEISIPAGQTKTVTVKLTPVSTGAGDVEMVVAVKNNATAMKNTVTISGFSSDISNFQVLDDEESGAYSLDAIISRVGKPKYVSLTPGDYAAVGSQLPNLKTMIWNCGDKGGFTATEASSIKSFFDSGKPVLILGTFVGSTIPTVTPNLNYSFGVSPRGWCRQGQATQGNITLVGYPNDPITNGMDFGSSVIYYFHSGIQCNNPKTYPILRFKTVDTCVAFRTELPSGRVVFLGLNIKQIKLQSVQDALIKNSLNWLEGVGPKVSTTTPSIDFGDVVNNTTKDIDIPLTNDGTEDLVITSASVKDYTSIYAVTTSLPLTITPGQTSNLTLRFSPNFESPFPETLEIKSNAVNNSVLLITVNGKGVASNGPIIATDKSTIQFAKVAINNTKDMNLQISNTGSTDLTISEMSIPSQYSDAFTLKDVTLPLNIAAKAKQTVTFTFSPKEIRLYNNVPVTIKSNSISNATMTVYLQGEGTEPSSVYDGIAGDAQFNITASPNPFADKINIKITIGEKITNSISLVIIDATGREIEHLLNQTLSEGQHSVMFNGSNLSNGVYFIIAKTGDKSVKLPVVLNR